MSKQIDIKFIGRGNYSHVPSGKIFNRNEVKPVTMELAEHLLKQSWVDGSNNKHPMFTKDFQKESVAKDNGVDLVESVRKRGGTAKSE